MGEFASAFYHKCYSGRGTQHNLGWSHLAGSRAEVGAVDASKQWRQQFNMLLSCLGGHSGTPLCACHSGTSLFLPSSCNPPPAPRSSVRVSSLFSSHCTYFHRNEMKINQRKTTVNNGLQTRGYSHCISEQIKEVKLATLSGPITDSSPS